MEYSDLEDLIDSIADEVANESPQSGYWKNLWGLIGQAKAGFRGARFPKLEEREAAWQKLNDLVESARRRSERERNEREKRTREWEEKRQRSTASARRVKAKLAGARPTSDIERMISSVVILPLTVLENALRGILGLQELDEVFEDLKACSKNLKDAWAVFNETKENMLPADKGSIYKSLQEAQERLNEAWDNWRRTKDKLHEDRQRAWEERNRERERRHREFVQRVEANISKLEAKIDKAETALEKQQRHLEDLREQYESAWNEDFKERCGGWIEEAEERIGDIENSIDRLKGWLKEEKAKLKE